VVVGEKKVDTGGTKVVFGGDLGGGQEFCNVAVFPRTSEGEKTIWEVTMSAGGDDGKLGEGGIFKLVIISGRAE